jgi:diaminohydroxyphosphoribosylaminopyrimidine deaminase/5-amino-6-(5-phosphoribosylamino)uracil reductase
MTERDAMRRALQIARDGWGRVAPNPLVGAVLLRDGKVVAEGYHAEYGQPHAEAAALMAAGDARGATCVVTLEPCTHVGKTPACTDALIAAGVARVVYAVADPHAEAGGGAERLRAAGVDVAAGLERDRAAALMAPFLFAQMSSDRPFVAVKLATSLDGFVADHTGRSQWISGEAARDWVHWLRAGFDAIGVGARTVAADDPALTVRGAVVPRRTPTRVVFARRSLPSEDRQLVRSAGAVPTRVFAEPEVDGSAASALRDAGVAVSGAEHLMAALRALRADGIESLLVEGGGTLVTALLEAGVVDRVYWVQAPIWLGNGIRGFGDRSPLDLADTPAWTVTERTALGADTLLVVDRELCLPAS